MRILAFVFTTLLFGHFAAADYRPPSPSHPVEVFRDTLHDETRDRDVPVKIYYPQDADGPCPVILFSHGLGGSAENYEYLGRYWAGCGYVSVHLQHAGSDSALWRNQSPLQARSALRDAVRNPQTAIDRAKDVPFVIDRISTRDFPLAGSLDLAHLGVAGHSFGGWSAMVAAGQSQPLVQTAFAEPRVKAAIQMSAPVVGNLDDAGLDKIKIPVFHMTGTLDDSPVGETAAAQRRFLYDRMISPGSCLLIFDGANHMTFADRAVRSKDPEFQRLIQLSSTAFWDAWLRGEESARTWLYGEGFRSALGKLGTFEVRD